MLVRRKDAIDSISEFRRKKGRKTYTEYRAYLGTRPNGEKIRVSRSTRMEIVKAIDEFYEHAREAGELFTSMKPTQLMEAKIAQETLVDANAGISLIECARWYVAHVGGTRMPDVPLYDVFMEYYNGFDEKQRLHRTTVMSRVGKWVEMFGPSRRAYDVTIESVVEYLSRFANPKTYNNHLGYIKSFLQWCTEKNHRYIPENPLAEMRLKKIAYSEPKYARREAVEKLLRHFEEHGKRREILYMMLSYFCGVRHEEIVRMKPDHINVDERTVRIAMPKGWTQGVSPRCVPMEENVAAWFNAWGLRDAMDASFVPGTMRKHIDIAAKKLCVQIPRNAGRHTFITMHVAAFGDGSRTESIAGTSKAMRSEHYMGLATKGAGLAYFAILPSR